MRSLAIADGPRASLHAWFPHRGYLQVARFHCWESPKLVGEVKDRPRSRPLGVCTTSNPRPLWLLES